MPGVEYQANVLESLQRGMLVTPINFLGQFALSAAMLIPPLLLYGWCVVRRNWQLLFVTVLLVLVVCIGLLRVFYLWWPPVACLIVLALEFVAWTLLTRTRNGDTATH
jgi:adenylate cyclase